MLTSSESGALRNETKTTLQTWAIVLGTLATAAQLYLVWGFGFFPTVDGPAHTHLAYAMYEALRGDGFYGALVELNPRFNPNMATQAVLVALMTVAPPLIAEKIWLTLYFVSFACASAYALSGINRNALCLLPLLMFSSLSLPLAFGFYNFAFSTVVFLAWFGYWWRHRNEFNARVVLTHALLAAIAYTTHIFAFVATVMAIAATGLAAIFMHARLEAGDDNQLSGGWRRAFLTHAISPLLGSLPILIASLYFLFGRFGSKTATGAANLDFDFLRRIQAFLAGTSFAPYDDIEFMAAAMLAPVLVTAALLLLRKSPNARRSLPFAACFLAFFALYLAMPQQWIVRWMPSRLQPLVFVVLLLWAAALVPSSIKPRHWKLVGASGLALVLLSLVPRFQVFSHLDGYYREYASAAPYIAKNSTLVSIRLNNQLDGRPFPAKIDMLIQAGSSIASRRHSVDLKNFQGQSDKHPIQFRPNIGATAALGGDGALISLSPQIRLMAYEQQTGRPIDYVLVYGFRKAAMNPGGLASLDRQLRDNYRPVFVSKPRGFVHLYARNSGGPPVDGM